MFFHVYIYTNKKSIFFHFLRISLSKLFMVTKLYSSKTLAGIANILRLIDLFNDSYSSALGLQALEFDPGNQKYCSNLISTNEYKKDRGQY